MEYDYVEVNFRVLLSPIVYLAYRGEVCEYVGMSTNGLARVLNSSHHAISELLFGDVPLVRLFIIPCQNAEMAAKIEKEKIAELQPIRNRKPTKLRRKRSELSFRDRQKSDGYSCSHSEQEVKRWDPITKNFQ